MAKKKHFRLINREISWLNFNERVLQEAEDYNTPLLSRIKFLGIFSNNLDEFFRVRVATLKRIVGLSREAKSSMGFNPKKVLKQIHDKVVQQHQRFEAIYENIKQELAQSNTFIIDETQFTAQQGKAVKQYFHQKVRPVLVPLMISDIDELPDLRDGSVYLALHLSCSNNNIPIKYALIELPTKKVSRFWVLKEEDKNFVILLDDIIRYCLTDIFAIFGYDTCKAYTIKLTKDAETDIDNDVSKSFLELIYLSLKQRKYGQPVRFIHDQDIDKGLLDFLVRRLGITEGDNIISAGRYHNFKDFMAFPNVGPSNLQLQLPKPLPHPHVHPHESLFKRIEEQDVLLHVPYQSYYPVIDFLREAAIDPKVVQIKITLYRVAKDSNIINALINARKNGKDVTAVVELQARFDEAANIEWAKLLQENGIKVLHGPQNIKIHAKVCAITRQTANNDTKLFVYVGTGNFNESTAKIYGDLGIFTAHKGIAKDVKRLFRFIEEQRSFNKPFKHLLVSSKNMVNDLYQFIDVEIANAKAGKEAYIVAKTNSLNDEGMIKKLYEAANAGVKVKLIIRGICCLNPHEHYAKNNIEAISIVAQYLEHARIYVFANADADERIYISSADWMERNLHRRIEAACPIYDPILREEIKQVLKMQLRDTAKARWLNHPEGNVFKKQSAGHAFNSQNELYKYYHKMLHT